MGQEKGDLLPCPAAGLARTPGVLEEVVARGHTAEHVAVGLEPHHQTQLSFDLMETLNLCFSVTFVTSTVPARVSVLLSSGPSL